MKHLKIYERYKIEYHIGDYVLLNVKKITKNLIGTESPPTDNFAHIDYIQDNGFDVIYEVTLPSYGDNEIYEVKEEEIIRKLTKEEIKIFKEKQKLYQDSNRYNI
jgi:hypothetical protein